MDVLETSAFNPHRVGFFFTSFGSHLPPLSWLEKRLNATAEEAAYSAGGDNFRADNGSPPDISLILFAFDAARLVGLTVLHIHPADSRCICSA